MAIAMSARARRSTSNTSPRTRPASCMSVTREYYVNDAGKQVEALRDSFIGRLRQQIGEDIPDSAFGSTFQYPGEEIADAARAALAADPAKWRPPFDTPEKLDAA